MSAPFFLPFNFQPSSVAVKTGSYTIPAGKYARVTATIEGAGTFTINAVSALSGTSFVNVDVVSAVSATASYTVPSGFSAAITGISSAETTFSVNANGSNTLAANTYSATHYIGPAGTFTVAGVFTHSARIQGLQTLSNNGILVETFWIPTGTIINGTGTWRAVVEEYNEIT